MLGAPKGFFFVGVANVESQTLVECKKLLVLSTFYESQLGSWLVVIRERSEKGGEGPGAENVVNKWCFRRQKAMVLQGNVPCGKTVTVGIDSP